MNNDCLVLTVDYSLNIANNSVEMEGNYKCQLRLMSSAFTLMDESVPGSLQVFVPADAPIISRN